MKELIVLLTAAAPVLEVRASIPLGIAIYHLPEATTIILSILGSLLPVFPLLWFLTYMVEHLRKISFFDKFFQWLFDHTRAKSKLIEDLELVGLALFIAVPLPGTGVWTGTIAAYLLGLRWMPTFIAAMIGTTIASLLVYGATIGVLNFIL
jgi:uncharacterized membrane protein